MDRYKWRSHLTRQLSATAIQQEVRKFKPRYNVDNVTPLVGGGTNLNLLITPTSNDDPLVFRAYSRGRSAQEREVEVLSALKSVVEAPEIIGTSSFGEEDTTYILYRYIDGVTFQQIKESGSLRDTAEAAAAIGRALASLGTISAFALAKLSGVLEIKPRPVFRHDSSLLLERLGQAETNRLLELVDAWSEAISYIYSESSLVHGDFNNRNTVLTNQDEGWIVSGLIDWEQAFFGSPLWDVSRFICYEDECQPLREPYFTDAYKTAGGHIPENWAALTRVLNALSAAESLARDDLQEHFIPDLCEIVSAATGMRPR